MIDRSAARLPSSPVFVKMLKHVASQAYGFRSSYVDERNYRYLKRLVWFYHVQLAKTREGRVTARGRILNIFSRRVVLPGAKWRV